MKAHEHYILTRPPVVFDDRIQIVNEDFSE